MVEFYMESHLLKSNFLLYQLRLDSYMAMLFIEKGLIFPRPIWFNLGTFQCFTHSVNTNMAMTMTDGETFDILIIHMKKCA